LGSGSFIYFPSFSAISSIPTNAQLATTVARSYKLLKNFRYVITCNGHYTVRSACRDQFWAHEICIAKPSANDELWVFRAFWAEFPIITALLL
jgi:hypothetical protein